MKILQVSNGFPPVDRGGVESYTYALTKRLVSAGCEVSVFCREPGWGHPIHSIREDVVDGIPVRFVANRFEYATPIAIRYRDPQMEPVFVDWVTRQRPDVIHFQHTHGLSASLLGVVHQLQIPCVTTLHDYWYMCPQINLLRPDFGICAGSHRKVNCYECLYGTPVPPAQPEGVDISLGEQPGEPHEIRPLGLSDAVYYPLQKILPLPVRKALLSAYDFARMKAVPRARSWLKWEPPPDLTPLRVRARYMRELLSSCPCIIVPSRSVKPRYADFGVPEAQIRVIPHGMDLAIWRGFKSAPRPLGEGFRFGYIGSVLRHKGVDVAVRAFQQLDEPGARLSIHGFEFPDMLYSKELHGLTNGDPRIQFAGPYTQSELPAILNQIDVLLIPARWHETFSIVTREAVLASLPVLASRMGGIPDAIEHGVNGILLPPGDTGAWVRAMRRVARDRHLVASLQRAQLGRKLKSMEQHVAELRQIYAELVSAPRGRVAHPTG